MIYILYNYNSDIISRINNINKPVIKLLKEKEGTTSIYTNNVSVYSTSAGGKKRDAVASTSKFTSTSGKVIKAVVMFPVFLLMPPRALRNCM